MEGISKKLFMFQGLYYKCVHLLLLIKFNIVNIDILQKINVVLPLMTQDYRYWIGARDAAGNNQHMWLGNGQDLTDNSIMWGPGAPSHGSEDRSEDCVFISKGNGKLGDINCGSSFSYVCEV